jgi:hypothetical protein
MICMDCKQLCIDKNEVYARPFKGGKLFVTDLPLTSCDCDSWYTLGDICIGGFYATLLEKHEITGEHVVSLTQLKRVYSLAFVLDYKSIKNIPT